MDSIGSKKKKTNEKQEMPWLLILELRIRGSQWVTSGPLFTQSEWRNSMKTLDKTLEEANWSETACAGTATVATRLMFRRSRISKLTQLRAQSATNKRPKARKVTQTSLVSPVFQRNPKTPLNPVYPVEKTTGSRATAQGGKRRVD